MFFGKRTTVDSWYYYLSLILIAFLDAAAQVVVLGVWPKSIDPYMRVILLQEGPSTTSLFLKASVSPIGNKSNHQNAPLIGSRSGLDDDRHLENNGLSGENVSLSISDTISRAINSPTTEPKIQTHLLDSLLGEAHAHSDLGVCIKVVCLMIQFIHSFALFIIIISLANHYAAAINNINENLDKYEFRRLLKQLIILRDSSEQISLLVSVPFSLIIILVFMRQIALNGVFIQSTMLPYENWAVLVQSFTCSITIFMVFFYCDGLQSASKQTHRLKTEQTVVHENLGGNQSIYEFLDYLDRLSKSIRITFFNIIAINKSSLVGLYGHILTLTFVTS